MSKNTMQMEELLRELKLSQIEATDKYGNTALHLAVKNKTFTQKKIVQVIEVLIGRGMNPDSKNNKNQTALHLAVLYRMKDVIDCLMVHKVNLDLVAHLFIRHEYATFQELLTQMGNIDEWYGEILRMETESVEFAEWLISKGIDFDCKNQENGSALNMAIEHNLQHILPVLLKYTKNINLVDKENKMLLNFFLQANFRSTYFSTVSINKKWYANRYAADIVRTLLDRGVSAKAEDKDKFTPVELAIEGQEEISVIEILIEHSLNISHRDNYMYVDTLFQTVIRLYFLSAGPSQSEYYLKILRALMIKGINVIELNKVDKFEYTTLRSAVEDRKLRLIKLLEEYGADFSFTTKDGKSLLHLLLVGTVDGKTEVDAEMKVCDLLISKGCQVNARDLNGNTPLHEAVVHDNVAMVRKLIAHGADVHCRTNGGMTPLQIAVAKRHNVRVIELLEESGADFSVTTVDDKNLLHLLVQRPVDMKTNHAKKTALFNLLIRKNCQVNAKDVDGNTPLHEVVDVAIARKLIEHGAEVNCKASSGWTPLQVAVSKKRDFRLIELMLENEADTSVISEGGHNFLHLFALYPLYILSSVDEKKALFSLLIALISKGCHVNKTEETGVTPLHMAAMVNDVTVVSFFIDRGADVNCRNNRKETPLHFAMKNDDVLEVTKLLLERGANVNAKDLQGFTVLHTIALRARYERFRRALIIFLQYGADVNAQDLRGLSVLFYARRQDRDDRIKLQRSFRISDITKLLTLHSIKLKAVNLPWDHEINSGLGDLDKMYRTENYCEKYNNECLREIEILKTTFIDSCTSLYTLLYMDPNRRRVHIYNKKLQQLVYSPTLKNKFPKYYTLVMASYRDALTRKSLLQPAKEAWLELTKISLPEVCIELVFSFLTNADLFNIIEKN